MGVLARLSTSLIHLDLLMAKHNVCLIRHVLQQAAHSCKLAQNTLRFRNQFCFIEFWIWKWSHLRTDSTASS